MTNYHHTVTLDTADGPMSMYIAAPEGDEPHPAVMVIHGMHGASSFEFGVADRLADHGYVAAVPDLFHRGPGCFTVDQLNNRRRSLTDPLLIPDVNRAFAHLEASPYAQREYLGIMGFCMGGRTSFLMAATRSDLRAAADFYGGGIHDAQAPSPAPIALTANIVCPIIIFDGELDARPTPEEVRKTAAELERQGKVHEVHIYPGADHGFLGRGVNPDAVADAWDRLFGWFDRYLAPAAVASR